MTGRGCAESACTELMTIEELHELAELVECRGDVFVRYSRGPIDDADRPSRDYESGLVYAGAVGDAAAPGAVVDSAAGRLGGGYATKQAPAAAARAGRRDAAARRLRRRTNHRPSQTCGPQQCLAVCRRDRRARREQPGQCWLASSQDVRRGRSPRRHQPPAGTRAAHCRHLHRSGRPRPPPPRILRGHVLRRAAPSRSPGAASTRLRTP
jgi:hypothetical protein